MESPFLTVVNPWVGVLGLTCFRTWAAMPRTTKSHGCNLLLSSSPRDSCKNDEDDTEKETEEAANTAD